jgi:hypothetical protein
VGRVEARLKPLRCDVSVATVRAQLAAHLLTGYGLVRESAEPVPFMRVPSRSPVHLEFGVSVDRSEPMNRREDLTVSTVVVLVCYQLPPKDRVAGYDAMLVQDATVRAAVLLSAWANGPRLASFLYQQTTRTAGIDGWIFIEQTYSAIHPT